MDGSRIVRIACLRAFYAPYVATMRHDDHSIFGNKWSPRACAAPNVTAFTPAYAINQEGRRLWLSATVDF